MADETTTTDILTLTAEIVASYVGNAAHVQAADIPTIIRSVRAAITPDALISFIDNKPYKTLKRHLSRHGLDMAGYRERYGLPKDYPSVAPNYSAARSAMAKKLGLGAQRRKSSEASAPAAPKGRARKKAAADT